MTLILKVITRQSSAHFYREIFIRYKRDKFYISRQKVLQSQGTQNYGFEF